MCQVFQQFQQETILTVSLSREHQVQSSEQQKEQGWLLDRGWLAETPVKSRGCPA